MKVLITNVFGPLNRGDHELFQELIRHFDGADVSLSAIARDPELSKRHFPSVTFYEQLGKASRGNKLKQVLTRIFYLVASFIYPYNKSLAARLLPTSQYGALNAMKEADLVVGCAGGYIEDSSLSLYPQLAQLLLAGRLRKELLLAPVSLGPVRKKVPKLLAKRALQGCSKIFVRELHSKRFCDVLDVPTELANDLAFLNQVESAAHSIDGTAAKHICATVIKWSFPGAANPEEALESYCQRFALVLNKLAYETGLPIKLIVQVENDLPAIERVAELCNAECEIMRDAKSPELIKQLLRESFCLLASRFHSAVFALTVGCPVIALAYLPKTTGMLELYNVPELGRSIDDFDAEELSQALLHLGNNRGAFEQKRDRLLTAVKDLGNPFKTYLDARLKA